MSFRSFDSFESVGIGSFKYKNCKGAKEYNNYYIDIQVGDGTGKVIAIYRFGTEFMNQQSGKTEKYIGNIEKVENGSITFRVFKQESTVWEEKGGGTGKKDCDMVITMKVEKESINWPKEFETEESFSGVKILKKDEKPDKRYYE